MQHLQQCTMCPSKMISQTPMLAPYYDESLPRGRPLCYRGSTISLMAVRSSLSITISVKAGIHTVNSAEATNRAMATALTAG